MENYNTKTYLRNKNSVTQQQSSPASLTKLNSTISYKENIDIKNVNIFIFCYKICSFGRISDLCKEYFY